LNNITLRQLRYLVALADTGHFGRAAEASNISQPSLSAQIQELEAAIGVTLVERRNRRAILFTPAGRAVVERARRILGLVADLTHTARAVAEPLAAELRLGVIPTLGPYLLPPLLPTLRTAFPNLRLYLREDLTGRLVTRLHSGDLDLLLLALPLDEDGIDTLALFDEPFVVALPRNHRLLAKPALTEADLGGERLLLLEEGHCFRDQALAVCHRAGAADRDDFAATSLDTLRAMVAGGLGVTLLPGLAGQGGMAQEVALRPFQPPGPTRRIGLAWRAGAPRADEYRMLGAWLAGNLPPGMGLDPPAIHAVNNPTGR